MTRQLLLYRHGKSDRSDGSLDDYDRPLNSRGRSAAPRMGKAMRAMGLDPRLVLCSTSARTQQTLLLTLNQLGWGRTVKLLRGLYLAEVPEILAIVQAIPDEVEQAMVIGHNPGLEQLALSLTREGEGDSAARARLAEKFPTGALAILSFSGRWSGVGPGGTQLATFLTPSEIG